MKNDFDGGLENLSLNNTEGNLKIDAYLSMSFPYLIIPIPKDFVLHNYEQCSITYDNRKELLKNHQG